MAKAATAAAAAASRQFNGTGAIGPLMEYVLRLCMHMRERARTTANR